MNGSAALTALALHLQLGPLCPGTPRAQSGSQVPPGSLGDGTTGTGGVI